MLIKYKKADKIDKTGLERTITYHSIYKGLCLRQQDLIAVSI